MEKERQCVIFQSSDGQRFKVDDDLIGMCPTAKHVLSGRRTSFRNALGGSTFAIEGSHVLLKREGRVLATLLSDSPEEVVVSFPEHSLEAAKGSDVEKRQWDAIFMQLDQSALCELASAAYYLDVKPLVNLTSRIIASKISGKTTEELRETLGDISLSDTHPGDGMYSTRSRLQRKLNRNQAPAIDGASNAKAANVKDDRTVDELLNFIDGNPAGSASEAKRQKRKLKKQQKKAVDDEGKVRAESPDGNDSRSHSPASASPEPTSPHPQRAGAQASKGKHADAQRRIDGERKFTNHQRLGGGHSPSAGASAKGSSSGAQREKLTLPASTFAKVRKAVEDGDRPAPSVSPNEVVWAGESDADDFGLAPEQQEALDREIEEFRRRLENSKRYVGIASIAQ